jgi:parallel beta-helix repeat protein
MSKAKWHDSSFWIPILIIIGLAMPIINIPQEASGISVVIVSDKSSDNPDYSSITAAIIGEDPGTYIDVYYGEDGYYYENINIDKLMNIYGNGDVTIVGNDAEPAVTISADGSQFHDIDVLITSEEEKIQPGIKIDAEGCSVYDVSVMSCYIGIELVGYKHGNTIEDNVLNYNDYAGIVGFFSDDNVIKYNDIRHNGVYGIELDRCDDTNIHNNYFKDNNDNYAVYLEDCVDNEIYYNNFEGNRDSTQPSCQARDNNTNDANHWDDGTDDGGNYWDDNLQADPYDIDGGNSEDNERNANHFEAGPR